MKQQWSRCNSRLEGCLFQKYGSTTEKNSVLDHGNFSWHDSQVILYSRDKKYVARDGRDLEISFAQIRWSTISKKSIMILNLITFSCGQPVQFDVNDIGHKTHC